MWQVPDADLTNNSMATDDFEKFPIALIPITSIEVHHAVCGTKCDDLVFLIEGDAEDVVVAACR